MTQAISPATLAQIEGLGLRARAVVQGAFAGLHRSPHRGQSVEFAEHKEYSPGDEIKHVDWKALARVDRYYVKRFEEETDLRAYLCVDASASMGYRGAPLSKLEYAATLAAALAYVLLRQQDQVGLCILAGQRPMFLPPSARDGYLPLVFETLEGLKPAGALDLRSATQSVAERVKRRSLIVWFSDLLDSREGALDGISHLRARGHDVVVFQLLDPDELQLPFSEPTIFESMEDARQVHTDPEFARAEYLRALNGFLQSTRNLFASSDVDYRMIDTATAPGDALRDFLSRRARTRLRA